MQEGGQDDGVRSESNKPQILPEAAPPPMLMTRSVSDVCLHHTWSIRGLSPFVVPLDLRRASCSRMEEDMSQFLRNHRANLTTAATTDHRDAQQQQEEDGSSDEGTFVRFFWGELQEHGNGEMTTKNNNGDDEDGEHPSTTNKRKLDVDDNLRDLRQQRHLFIDIRTNDEPSASLVCCFPQFVIKDEGNNGRTCTPGNATIKSFDFLLTRGSKSSFEAAFGWFETFTGCAIAKSPFSPTVVDVAQAMTLWTSEHLQRLRDSKDALLVDNDSRENDTALLQKSKPLTLTYAVPSEFAISGLETVSLTVPPVALMRLCNDILQSRGRRHEKSDSPAPPDKIESVPIVKALQCFMRETFRINIERFSLVNGSCVAAVLGCDGRCKPLCADLLGIVLREVQFMVQHQSPGK